METFGSCLVSSLAVSGNRLRRSRNNRRRRRGHALSGERKIHTESENSMAEENSKVKIWRMILIAIDFEGLGDYRPLGCSPKRRCKWRKVVPVPPPHVFRQGLPTR